MGKTVRRKHDGCLGCKRAVEEGERWLHLCENCDVYFPWYLMEVQLIYRCPFHCTAVCRVNPADTPQVLGSITPLVSALQQLMKRQRKQRGTRASPNPSVRAVPSAPKQHGLSIVWTEQRLSTALSWTPSIRDIGTGAGRLSKPAPVIYKAGDPTGLSNHGSVPRYKHWASRSDVQARCRCAGAGRAVAPLLPSHQCHLQHLAGP